MPSSFEVCVNIGQLGGIALGADFKQCSLPFNIVASILEDEESGQEYYQISLNLLFFYFDIRLFIGGE